MRSFLITVACFAALAGGVFLSHVALDRPFAVAQVVDSGAASSALATSGAVVTSVAAGMARGNDNAATPATTYPAHANWTWQTTDGKTYENVVITNLGTTEVTIAHSLGIAHVRLSDLPPDIASELHSADTAAPAATNAP